MAPVGRTALYVRMRILSLEGFAVPSSDLASFCVGRLDVSCLLYSLARAVALSFSFVHLSSGWTKYQI